jgi:hypothetical protein
MKVLLISANTERINLPALPLGLALVGAAARAAGHDATFLNLMFEGDAESRYRPEDVRRISEMLACGGIHRHGFLLLGGPGETRESVEESLAFADSLRLGSLKTTVGIRIYPGTPLARMALWEGVITPEDDLLWPRFYLAPGLGEWLPQAASGRPATS